VGFEELMFLAGASFMAGFSGALMPGTVFVAVVLQAARKGWKVGPQIILGHAVLEAPLEMALVLGLSTFIGIQLVRTVVGFVGGAFLLWMSLGLLKASRHAKFPATINGSKSVSSHPVLSGLLASSVNPYFYVWWATVGNMFTVKGLEIAGLIGVAVFFLSHWMSDLSWYTFLSWSVSKSRRYMTDQVYRIVLGACGIFLVILGLIFVYGAMSGTI
jgi:threonine/homoserine/homoserine lactone efflux protein